MFTDRRVRATSPPVIDYFHHNSVLFFIIENQDSSNSINWMFSKTLQSNLHRLRQKKGLKLGTEIHITFPTLTLPIREVKGCPSTLLSLCLWRPFYLSFPFLSSLVSILARSFGTLKGSSRWRSFYRVYGLQISTSLCCFHNQIHKITHPIPVCEN